MNFEDIADIVGELTSLKFFPGDAAGRLAVMKLIAKMAANQDQVEWLVNRTLQLESTLEYREALDVLKKTEQDVIPRVENPEDKRDLEELCRMVRLSMGSGDGKKMEEASNALNDRLLNYAYLL